MGQTKNVSGHTPGPSYLIGYDPPNPPDIGCATFMRADASGHVAVATVHVYDKEFGAELCRRWSSHADLVATLRRIAACTDPQGEWRDDADLDPAACVELARAAIAKAGGA